MNANIIFIILFGIGLTNSLPVYMLNNLDVDGMEHATTIATSEFVYKMENDKSKMLFNIIINKEADFYYIFEKSQYLNICRANKKYTFLKIFK